MESHTIGSQPQQPLPEGQFYMVQSHNGSIPPLGPKPVIVTCPSCNARKMSIVKYETATKTHLIAAIMCLFGLICCACIPYCVDSCKSANHYCEDCGTYLGMYNSQ